MMTYAEALAIIAAQAPQRRCERVALAAAAGRIVAEDIRLAHDQPPFDRATMDGYALRLLGQQARFTVRATVSAGTSYDGALAPGEAVRIMTGAPCPPGTTVVPVEATDGGHDAVTVGDSTALQPGRNIAWRGEDGRAGALVVEAGTRLSPVILALLAMAGAPTPQVAIGPTLSIITTGDELEGQGAASIRDSNGPLLRAFLDCLGLTAEVLHADDTPENLQRAIHEAASRSDIIVTTGGVSAGDRDLVPQVAQDEGFTTLFHHLAMQPGKPVLLGRRGGQYLVGLPGNPVSVLATAHLVLWPLLARFLGTPPPRWLELPVMVPWTHRGKRQLFLPARVVAGGLQVVAWNGSGDLLAAAAADGLIDLPSGTQVASGALGRFLPYAGGRLGEIARLPERARAT